MRNGRIGTRPSARRDESKARMERMEKVVNLITWPNALPGVQAALRPFWSNPVKPGQTVFQPGSPGMAFDCPCHILWVPCHNTQRMVVCFDSGHRCRHAIRNCPIVPGQTQSNLVKPGQSEKRGVTVKPHGACRLFQITTKYSKNHCINKHC